MVSRGTGNLVKSLALLEQAREDVYFAQLDRELIASLHRKYNLSTKALDKRAEPALPQPDSVSSA